MKPKLTRSWFIAMLLAGFAVGWTARPFLEYLPFDPTIAGTVGAVLIVVIAFAVIRRAVARDP